MPLTPEQQERADALKAARDYVWKSFDLHFKQRNEFLRTYSAIAVAVYAAFGFVLKEQQHVFGLFVATFSILLCLLFLKVDRGAKQYMWDYRSFLRADEELMARTLTPVDADLAQHVKLFAKTGQRPGGYGAAIRMFYVANMLLAAAFAIVSRRAVSDFLARTMRYRGS
jgi:hypothetical protein